MQSLSPASFADFSIVASRGTAPAPGVPVTLDDRWTLITDAKGRVRFDGLPAGARCEVAQRLDELREIVDGEGHAAGQRLVEEHAADVEIGPPVEVTRAEDLLGDA